MTARSSRLTWTAFSLCGFIAVMLVFIPIFIIRPFRYESPRGLWLAMALRQRAPAGTLLATMTCLLLGFILWKRVGIWRRALLILCMVVITFSAVMARLNHFEWMFHPIDGPQFLAQSQSKLDPKEMILAVRFGEDARAYPIGQMAYHHVLNDVVGGVPVAVTY